MSIVNRITLTFFCLSALFSSSVFIGTVSAQTSNVGLYKTFEQSIENSKSYSNKFTEVELTCSYTSPTGKKIDFFGFFDGDGKGGGNKNSGNVWKMRFMPDEIGQWRYTYTWDDGTAGGEGTFSCVAEGAGKGILRAYKDNPRWYAYNGTDPVYIKSYYESATGSLSQPFDWVVKNVYGVLVDNGYNHLQVHWLLPLCRYDVIYQDGPPQTEKNLALYESGKASSTMNLNVWKLMEVHMHWLNDHDVGIHPFMGFSGEKNGGLDWKKLSGSEQDFFVKYTIARLAPFANVAAWNYVWEVAGNDEKGELGLMRFIQKYDVFNHLRTYQDEMPESHEYKRAEYTLASVENHIDPNKKDRDQWKEGWTHHEACLLGYVPGKPVIMVEGNALWVRYWKTVNDVGATPDNLRQAAWGCVTAGASFIWSGHSEPPLVATGKGGLPFTDNSNPYRASAKHLDIVSDVMTKEVAFYRMTPQDALLSSHDSKKVWCLAESGKQYLVFSSTGKSFSLNVASGNYSKNSWIDAKTGTVKTLEAINETTPKSFAFSPPDTKTDWVLLLRDEIPTAVTSADFGNRHKQVTSPKYDAIRNQSMRYTLNGKQTMSTKRLPTGVYIIKEHKTAGVTTRRVFHKGNQDKNSSNHQWK